MKQRPSFAAAAVAVASLAALLIVASSAPARALDIETDDDVLIVNQGKVAKSWRPESTSLFEVGPYESLLELFVRPDDGEEFDEPQVLVVDDREQKNIEVILDGDAAFGSLDARMTSDFTDEDYEEEKAKVLAAKSKSKSKSRKNEFEDEESSEDTSDDVDDDDYDVLRNTGDDFGDYSLQISFICHKSGDHKIVINVTYSRVGSKTPKSVAFALLKHCAAGGARDGFQMYTGDDVVAIKNGRVWSKFDYVAPASESVTTFHMWIDETHGTQVLGAANIKVVGVTSPSLVMHLSGRGAQESVIDEFPTPISVVYECHGAGRFVVSLTLQIPPFDPVEVRWLKDCGGGTREGFDIGSTDEIYDDIALDGQLLPTFNFTSPPGERSTSFWLSMSNGQSQLIDKPVVSITTRGDKGLVAHPVIAGELLHGGVVDDLPREIIVDYNCYTKGKIDIRLIIPVHYYKSIIIDYVKVCSKLPPLESNDWTANQIIVLLSFGFAAAAVGIWAYFRYVHVSSDRPYKRLVPVDPA